MTSELFIGLFGSILGGVAVSLVSFLGNKGKTKAETDKLLAEADRIRAETDNLLAPGGLAGEHQGAVPPGWHVSGIWTQDYEIAIDRTVAHSGSASARLQARPGARGFATLMQKVPSRSMHGQRIRMSAYVKTEDVEHAALWMRVDGRDFEMLSFDNMDNRPIVGTADWRQHSIVLEVASSSQDIAFGVFLSRRGRMWVDDFVFEPVQADVPTTDLLGGESKLAMPGNLDFED